MSKIPAVVSLFNSKYKIGDTMIFKDRDGSRVVTLISYAMQDHHFDWVVSVQNLNYGSDNKVVVPYRVKLKELYEVVVKVGQEWLQVKYVGTENSNHYKTCKVVNEFELDGNDHVTVQDEEGHFEVYEYTEFIEKHQISKG